MRYQSTVFAQLLKAVPRGWFAKLAQQHHTGRAKRTFSDWNHLLAMVAAHLVGAGSLRELERLLERHPGVLPHLGLVGAPRSTLADANAGRSAALFEAVARHLCGELAGRSREAVRLLDATRLLAGRPVEAWSRDGVKLHLALDPQGGRPTWFAVTPARVNDITAARTMPIEPGATYVFDKGYYGFAFWAELHANNCRFVTRLKKNSPLNDVRERCPQGHGILGERTARLSQRLAGQRSNPLQARLRVIEVEIDNGRRITLVSNDLEAPARRIADLYKTRWQVELFFKWIKQNLKLVHFLGESRNAIIIQIMAALIAYLLLRIATLRHTTRLPLQALARLMPALLFLRRDLASLLADPDPPDQPLSNPQFSLAFP